MCARHIEGHLFFDATEERIRDGKSLFKGSFTWIRLHIIGKFEIENDTVHMMLISSDWLEAALKSGRIKPGSAIDGLLVMPAADLEELMTSIAADPAAFPVQTELAIGVRR